jgi:hypothetical protein
MLSSHFISGDRMDMISWPSCSWIRKSTGSLSEPSKFPLGSVERSIPGIKLQPLRRLGETPGRSPLAYRFLRIVRTRTRLPARCRGEKADEGWIAASPVQRSVSVTLLQGLYPRRSALTCFSTIPWSLATPITFWRPGLMRKRDDLSVCLPLRFSVLMQIPLLEL